MSVHILRTLHRPPRIASIGVSRCTPASYRLVIALTGARNIQRRLLQSSGAHRNAPNATLDPSAHASAPPQAAESEASTTEEKCYYGPLAQTFRRLKIFSLGSLALSTIMTPFIFILETASSVPLVGRFALATTVMATSGVSTAMVAWTGRPYVHTLAWLPPEDIGALGPSKQPMGIELRTFEFGMHEKRTRVYDTAFLVPTTRPFATWELAEMVRMPAGEAEAEKRRGALPRDETVAEEVDYFGKVCGRWIVRWAEDGTGTCYPQGKIFRYFNVHEELLDRPIR